MEFHKIMSLNIFRIGQRQKILCNIGQNICTIHFQKNIFNRDKKITSIIFFSII